MRSLLMPGSTTLKRLGSYLLVFVILLALFFATGLWHYLDYFVYRTIYLEASRSVQLADNILLVDVPYKSDDNDPTEYRRRLADLLGVIAARERERPLAVVLDIWISNDRRGLPELTKAIEDLRRRRVDVYASFNPRAEDKRSAEQLWREHAQDLYRYVLKGYGHTSLDLYMGVLSYEPELQIPATAGTTESIWALPIKVALDMDWLDEPANSDAVVLPVGGEAAMDAQTIAFVHTGSDTSNGRFLASRGTATPVTPDLDKKIVLIGSVEEDDHEAVGAPQAGPKLIAWALNDQLKTSERTSRRPLNNPTLVLGQVLFFALFTVLVFALLFEYVRRMQARPVLIASLSVGTSAVALVTVAAAALALTYVVPVGLTLFAIALTGTLAWRFALVFLVTGVAEGSGKYDAFISYSRRHGEWVVKNVYEPLEATRKADGSALTLFFDRNDIGLGEAFTAKYMRAIVDSRCFIPIFSDDYYARNHTRNEMDVAYKRSVEKKIVILPIAHSPQSVPEIYAHLNYVDAHANPRFIEDVQKALLEAVRADHAVEEAREDGL